MSIFETRDRSALARGALVMMAIVVCGRILPWVLARARTRAARDRTAVAEWEQARIDIADRARRRDTLVARRVRLDALRSAFIDAPSRAESEADLATAIAAAADSASLPVSDLRFTGASDTARGPAPLQRVRVRVSGEGTLAQASRFLARLERGPLLLGIRALALRRAEPGAGEMRVRLEVDVEALAAIGGTADRSAASGRERR